MSEKCEPYTRRLANGAMVQGQHAYVWASRLGSSFCAIKTRKPASDKGRGRVEIVYEK